MPADRPAFILETAKRKPTLLPYWPWALACLGLGLAAGASVDRATPDPSLYFIPPSLTVYFSLSISACLLSGAAAWTLIVYLSGRGGLTRTAGFLAIVSGAGVIVGALINGPARPDLISPAAAGLAAPLAMLPATRPEARIVRGISENSKPVAWIRAGALPSALLLLGFAAGLFLESATEGGYYSIGIPLGGLLLLVSGRQVFRRPKGLEHKHGDLKAKSTHVRLRLHERFTPMLRRLLLAEVAVAFTLAAAAFTFLDAYGTQFLSNPVSLYLPIAFGALAGLVMASVALPSIDKRWGRGVMLSTSLTPCAALPLLAGFAAAQPDLSAVLLVIALIVVVLGASPQRYALDFDLSPSKLRMPVTASVQAIKLAAAACAPWVVSLADRVGPGTGLALASLVGVAALAAFWPTLGDLGRRSA